MTRRKNKTSVRLLQMQVLMVTHGVLVRILLRQLVARVTQMRLLKKLGARTMMPAPRLLMLGKECLAIAWSIDSG